MSEKMDRLTSAFAELQEEVGTSLEAVAKVARQLIAAEQEVIKAEEALAVANKELNRLEVEVLPQLMAEAGNLTSIKTSDGFVVEVKPIYKASLPAKDPVKRAKALAWLRKYAPDLVKHEVSIGFTKGEGKLAEQAVSVLKQAGFENVVDEETVHHATLTAYVKEQIENAEPGKKPKLPSLDLFSAYIGSKATVKLPKPAKGRKEKR